MNAAAGRSWTPKLLHLLFDVDNTLVLSELLAFKACLSVVNQLLQAKGVDFRFTTERLMLRFVGYSFERMAIELSLEYGFCFDESRVEIVDGNLVRGELAILVMQEQCAVIAVLEREIRPTTGIVDLLERYAAYDKSAVSSSAERRIRVCLEGAGLARFIPHIFSANGSSKPDPRVYLETLKTLHLNADQCVAIEDSKTGVLAAHAANIPVIGYLGAYPEHEHTQLRQGLIDCGAIAVIADWSEFDKELTRLEQQLDSHHIR